MIGKAMTVFAKSPESGSLTSLYVSLNNNNHATTTSTLHTAGSTH